MITIQIWFNSTRFRKDLSVCRYSRLLIESNHFHAHTENSTSYSAVKLMLNQSKKFIYNLVSVNLTGITSIYRCVQKYILRLLEPLYNSVGFKENANDSHLDHLKRKMALRWACSMDHPGCLAESAKQYKMWMSNPSNYT